MTIWMNNNKSTKLIASWFLSQFDILNLNPKWKNHFFSIESDKNLMCCNNNKKEIDNMNEY